MQSSEQAGGGRVEVALSASADRAVEEPPHEPTKIPSFFLQLPRPTPLHTDIRAFAQEVLDWELG